MCVVTEVIDIFVFWYLMLDVRSTKSQIVRCIEQVSMLALEASYESQTIFSIAMCTR